MYNNNKVADCSVILVEPPPVEETKHTASEFNSMDAETAASSKSEDVPELASSKALPSIQELSRDSKALLSSSSDDEDEKLLPVKATGEEWLLVNNLLTTAKQQKQQTAGASSGTSTGHPAGDLHKSLSVDVKQCPAQLVECKSQNNMRARRDAFGAKRSVTIDQTSSLTLPLLTPVVNTPKRTRNHNSSGGGGDQVLLDAAVVVAVHSPVVVNSSLVNNNTKGGRTREPTMAFTSDNNCSSSINPISSLIPPPSSSSTVETLIDVSSTDAAATAPSTTRPRQQTAGDSREFARSISLPSPASESHPTAAAAASEMNKHNNNNNQMVIPTFTVTINPMEDNEVTYDVPIPATANQSPELNHKLSNQIGNQLTPDQVRRSIANTTIIVHDDDEEKNRRCSIGSASSFQSEPPSKTGLLSLGDLGIRRISDISHINEIRRDVPGMDHLASEFYEISREPNPDAISLDSIHKRVLKRCKNMYISHSRSSNANKWFVVITTGFTLVGIIYGFWYKNFGPGAAMHHDSKSSS